MSLRSSPIAGKRIDLPTLYVLPPKDGQHMGAFKEPSITKNFCTDIYDRWNGGDGYSPLSQMGSNMDKGMVLTMSAWYAEEKYPLQGSQTGMSWLDGTNNWGKMIKAGPCDTSTTDSGVHHATFSDIRVGPIGSTVPNVPTPPPVPPTPPTPPSPPSSGQCCYNSCGSGNCQGGWCGQSQTHCEGNCNGIWCPGHE